MAEIIARAAEQAVFQQILDRNEPAFVAVFGRRRIGKTFLIEQYFKDKGHFFHVLGIEKATLGQQLMNFANEFAEAFLGGREPSPPKSWMEAFQELRKKIEELLPRKEKVILFFDELPWLASPRSGFLSALEHFWNRYFANMENIILIVCGSAASWMIKNILKNKGALHGRINYKIHLKPFDLSDTELYLQSRDIHFNRKQVVDLYMGIGGVAQYLKYVNRGWSSEQNINRLCFQSSGALYHEFEDLYRSLFKNYTSHISVVRALAKTRLGLEYDEIAKATGIASGGGLSSILNELSASDFITTYLVQSESKKVTQYRLVDEFTLFYLTWCEKHHKKSMIDEDPEYWQKQHNSAAWKAWSGYSFEGICLKHISKIKRALGISGVQTNSYKWIHRSEEKILNGAEGDLVIDRKDQCFNLGEIKYYDGEFVIDKEYAKQLRNKKNLFCEKVAKNKSVFLTLITTYGAKKNEYFQELVDQQIVLDDLFEGS